MFKKKISNNFFFNIVSERQNLAYAKQLRMRRRGHVFETKTTSTAPNFRTPHVKHFFYYCYCYSSSKSCTLQISGTAWSWTLIFLHKVDARPQMYLLVVSSILGQGSLSLGQKSAFLVHCLLQQNRLTFSPHFRTQGQLKCTEVTSRVGVHDFYPKLILGQKTLFLVQFLNGLYFKGCLYYSIYILTQYSQ